MNNIYTSLFKYNLGQGTAVTVPSSAILDLIEFSTLIGNDWKSNNTSAFLVRDQANFDKILFNNLDIISSSKRLEKIKNYEFKYKKTSEEFLKEWLSGEFPSTPQAHDWAATLKNIHYKNA